MFSCKSEYDRNSNLFSPHGRLIQVEYAMNSVALGLTAIGIRTDEGVVLCSEKGYTSPLINEECDLRKIENISEYCVCASAGYIADSRILLQCGRVEAVNHWFTYDEPMRIASVVDAMCETAASFSKIGDAKRQITRPLGAAFLVAGFEPDEGSTLFMIDPGACPIKRYAVAIGAGKQAVEALLKEQYRRDMSLADATVLALSCLREVMEQKISEKNIELCVINAPRNGIKYYDEEDLKPWLSQLPHREIDSLQS